MQVLMNLILDLFASGPNSGNAASEFGFMEGEDAELNTLRPLRGFLVFVLVVRPHFDLTHPAYAGKNREKFHQFL